LPLDWENLAEEIDSLGRSLRHELRSPIAVILEHLMKLEYSATIDPRRGWIETIVRERSEIELILADNPNLRRDAGRIITEEAPRVARLTTRVLRLHGEDSGNLAAPTYMEGQVLGDWFPGDAVSGDGAPLPSSAERDEPA
jgi:signal transduction histidine kinase